MKTISLLKEENIRRFAEAGFRLCKLGHKAPGETFTNFNMPGKVPGVGFLKVKFNPKPDTTMYPHNFGVVLDASHIVFDVDPRSFPEGRNSWKEFQADHCINLEKLCGFHVKTGGGGFHYYFKKPPKSLIRNSLKEYPGLEFKGIGRQVVGPGSVHPETHKPYVLVGNPMDLRSCPLEVLETIKREDISLDVGLAEFDDLDTNKNLVRQALAEHPKAIMGQRGNDTTFKAACICRDNGLSTDGALELLEEYNERCDPPWTIDELSALVNNAYRYGQNAVGSKNVKTDFDVIKDEEPEAPAKPPVVKATPSFLDDLEQEWAYSIGTKRFFRLRTMRTYDKEQFDDLHAGKTEKKTPSSFALMYPGMKKVECPTYWPGKDRFIEEDGEPKINLWTPVNLEPIRGGISVYKEFIDFLVGPDKAWIIHDFIAYLLRNPGEKVLWAILLQGENGIGKSVLTQIFSKLFGRRNVSQPRNQDIHEKYNGWMKACQLVVVHELMALGRLEMMNKLKDPITEPTVTIREMFTPIYEMPNRTNFFFLTNYEDAIVIPKGDRRFAVIFSPAKYHGPEYYEDIVKWMQGKGPSALLYYYLEEHQFDKKFLPKGHAPMTLDKQRMMNATRHPIEATIMDAFTDAEYPFHGRLANFTAIMDLVETRHKNVTKIQLATHLKSCGFEPVGNRIRLQNNDRGQLYAVRAPEMLRGLSDTKLRALYLDQEEKFSHGIDSLMAQDEQNRP